MAKWAENAEDGDTVTISLSEYQGLLNAEETLERLRAAGVDNWEGYSAAIEDEQ